MTELREIAFARSGDKGDVVNIGVIAREPRYYDVLVDQLTVERVAQYFQPVCRGRVDRYELSNVHALNFVLTEALGGGGIESLHVDNQGKSYSGAILGMEIEFEP